MKKSKKSTFFIFTGLILIFAYLTTFGLRTYYGDNSKVWIKGLADIRWGIDIRGGVDVTFTPPPDVSPTNDELDAAKSRIETRLIANNITDYEIYNDYNSSRIIVRFPWQSGDDDFDPEQAVKELGETALLTFREGTAQTPDALPLVITGTDVESAAPRIDNEGKYLVELKLKPDGVAKFAEATTRLSATQAQISIWLDENQISAPSVSVPITDGTCTISGSFDSESATDLANKINGGALPFKLITDNFSTISPSLGEGARDAMALAGIIAFVCVSIFVIFLYRLLGVIAMFGLVGQAFGSLAIISGFFGFNESFTLTIPGIAGIVLSIGMGVDANVITSERIKEELRAGKTLDGALYAGYHRAFSAIFDGNLTLMLIAFVLMGAFGTPAALPAKVLKPFFFMFGPSAAGTIYSFGYTLIVGAVLNFVFAVFACRVMTYSISRFQAFRKTKLYGGVVVGEDAALTKYLSKFDTPEKEKRGMGEALAGGLTITTAKKKGGAHGSK